MPLSFGIKVIFHEVEKKEEKKAWDMYLMDYQNMDKTNFMPFSEFYKKQKEPTKKQRTKEEILHETLEIREKIRKKKGGE